MVLSLVGFHEGCEDIQLISGLSPWFCVHELLNAAERALVVSGSLDRSNRHNASVRLDGCDIDGIVVCMCAYEANVNNSIWVIDLHD